MRIAALILVLMLVVAIATEVDGILGGRRRRRRRPKPTPKPTPAPCDSCSCAKRSVYLDGDIYPNDASLLEDYYSHYKWLPLWARDAILKAREKRGNKPLKYPKDCISSKLIKFAGKCRGFDVMAGGSHMKVCSATGELVTTIPHSVDDGKTCREIINTLNRRPECQ